MARTISASASSTADVKQDIEAAAQCYKFARDHGHPEGEINYRRCRRVLGEWDGSDRSSRISNNTSADVDWPAHFIACLDDRDASAELLASLERLKGEMAGLTDRPVECPVDTAPVPRAITPEGLNHPLIGGFRDDFGQCGLAGWTTELESLANRIQVGQGVGGTRIAKIAVGIALAMRYLHSQRIIHCSLNPDTVLVGWDWRVRVGTLTHSRPEGEELTEKNNWDFIGSPYIAPECYDNRFVLAGDVFSFGLVLYRLVVGRSPLPDTALWAVAKWLVLDEKRPEIPPSVAPLVAELIEDCWAPDPGERPSFDKILERMEAMDFRLTEGVNPSRVVRFVQEITKWETAHGLTGPYD
jgi:hypothetical protein